MGMYLGETLSRRWEVKERGLLSRVTGIPERVETAGPWRNCALDRQANKGCGSEDTNNKEASISMLRNCVDDKCDRAN